ncbi:PKD domain-containing protein [Methanolobus sp. ZRKC3]|uniref:PKD domain-containing protein n=1 Tax=Methanolobus sp. ZRKC3 TaxID=3125786 RepID=UPI00324FDDB1
MKKHTLLIFTLIVVLFAFTSTASAADRTIHSGERLSNSVIHPLLPMDTLTIEPGAVFMFDLAHSTTEYTINNYGRIEYLIRTDNHGTINNYGEVIIGIPIPLVNAGTINNHGIIDSTLIPIENQGAINNYPSGIFLGTVIGNPVNTAPIADANGPYTGTVGTPITFDGTESSDLEGPIVIYEWNFGDGNTGTGPSPTHTYTTPGTYTVNLTVTDLPIGPTSTPTPPIGATDVDTTTAIVTISSSSEEIPEFPTIAIPMIGILGLAFIFQRRKE